MSFHINAKKGDFAKVVLMPGDPLRAKWIAKTFLTNVKEVSNVRGILAFTGFYNKKRISVMASGMGQPSIAIYSNELYKEYGVEAIIRVGTCGGINDKLKLNDIVIAQTSSSDFNYVYDYRLNGVYSSCADYGLLETAVDVARKSKAKVYVGNVLSESTFYHFNFDKNHPWYESWDKLGVLAAEMESYALYANAAIHHKKALCILTVVNHLKRKGELSHKEKQTGLSNMIKIALKTAEKFA